MTAGEEKDVHRIVGCLRDAEMGSDRLRHPMVVFARKSPRRLILMRLYCLIDATGRVDDNVPSNRE
jgi:hypothetical protein